MYFPRKNGHEFLGFLLVFDQWNQGTLSPDSLGFFALGLRLQAGACRAQGRLRARVASLHQSPTDFRVRVIRSELLAEFFR